MIKKLLLSVLITLSVICNLSAQITTTVIKGIITDENGDAFPGATISALHHLTGIKYRVGTDYKGFFNLSDMKHDSPYTITMSYPGYENYVLKNVTLVPSQQLNLKVSMVPETFFSVITTAGEGYPKLKLGTDTNFIYSNGTETLWLLSNDTYSLMANLGIGSNRVTGNYRIKGDSLFLQTVQYFQRPVTMVIDTLKQNTAVTLIRVKNKKVLKREKLYFNKNKAFVEGLPVGVRDTFNIKEVYNDRTTSTLGCFPDNFYGDGAEPNKNYTYYLPFSKRKKIAVKFYQPVIKIKDVYIFAFKIESDRIVLNNKNVPTRSIEMVLKRFK